MSALFVVVIAWGVGCGLGTGRPARVRRALPFALAALPAALVPGGTLAAVAAVTAAAGAAAGALAARPTGLERLAEHRRGLAGPWRVRGRLASDPQPTGDGSTLDLRAEAVRVDDVWRLVDGIVRTYVAATPDPNWREGAGFEAFLVLRPDRPGANPGVPPSPRLKSAGVDLRSSLKSFLQLRRRPGRPVRGSSIRPRLRGRVDRLFDPGDAPLVRALLLGERADVDASLSAMLERAGLVHLLSISGLHVGLWFAVLWVLGRWLGLPRPLATGAALAAVLLIGTIVVPRPAVRRATLMALLLGGARLAGRRTEPLAALAVAAAVLVTLDPWVTHNGGFRLSVAATAAILVLAPSLEHAMRRLPAILRRSLAVTAAAQVGVAPLLAATAYRLPLGGLIGNLVAVPLTAAALVCGSAGLAADQLGLDALARGLATAAGTSLAAIAGVAERVAAVPGSAPVVAASGARLLWLLPAAVWVAVGRFRRSIRLAAAALGAGALTLALSASDELLRPTIHVLDVGQGDAIVVRTPGVDPVVVDAGGSATGSFDPGRQIVATVLRGLGVRRLGAVAVSHLHVDHAGGVGGLLAELPARAVWTASFPPDADAARGLRAAAGDVPLISLAAGQELAGGACTWEVLHPGGRWLRLGRRAIDNDASLVLALVCGPRAMLLTGDVEAAAEAAWLERGARLAGAVLKVPHHGSRTSSSAPLLDAVSPRHAVISAGWRNRFGFPHAEVLERYRRRATALYRTDRDGALTITLGRRVRVRGERWTAG